MKSILLFLIVVCIGCTSDRDKTPQDQNPVAVAVESNSEYGGLYKSRGKADLLEEIYDEQVDKSAELKKLEEEIDDAMRYHDSVSKFNEYDGIARNYFYSANAHKEQIKDSLLKQRLAAIIKNYSDRYEALVAPHKKLVKDLDTNNITISDLHTAFKVLKTLPNIHEYQKKNLPPVRPMNEAAAKQREVMRKLNEGIKKSGG